MPAQPVSAREREEIRSGIERGETDETIGDRLGQHPTTINAEINRNGGRGVYSAVAAQARAHRQRSRPTPEASSREIVIGESFASSRAVTCAARTGSATGSSRRSPTSASTRPCTRTAAGACVEGCTKGCTGGDAATSTAHPEARKPPRRPRWVSSA
jgi:hypothetical protein